MIWLFILLGIILVLLLVNFYFRAKTFKDINKELEKKKWKKLPKKKYAKKCYDFVSRKFPKVNKCWLKYPWRNFYFRNIWTYKKSVPCLIQNKLFQRCLLNKFHRREIKTIMASDFKKRILLHFYSKVKLNGNWVEVDVWGKRWGIPFGKNIHNARSRE
jgi:hypothetical protein